MVNQRQLDLLDAQILQAKAQMGEADAQSTLAQIALGYTRIVSPIDGTLGVREVHEGALLSPGTEVDTITPLDAVFVTANFTERQITNIHLGQRAIVRVDAFRNVPIQGKVAGIQPATGSQVSLVPADNYHREFHEDRPAHPGQDRTRPRGNAPDRAGPARHVRAGRGDHRRSGTGGYAVNDSPPATTAAFLSVPGSMRHGRPSRHRIAAGIGTATARSAATEQAATRHRPRADCRARRARRRPVHGGLGRSAAAQPSPAHR